MIYIRNRIDRKQMVMLKGFGSPLNEDLIEGIYFESIEYFKKVLLDYNAYNNKVRPHQALNAQKPEKFALIRQRIT